MNYKSQITNNISLIKYQSNFEQEFLELENFSQKMFLMTRWWIVQIKNYTTHPYFPELEPKLEPSSTLPRENLGCLPAGLIAKTAWHLPPFLCSWQIFPKIWPIKDRKLASFTRFLLPRSASLPHCQGTIWITHHQVLHDKWQNCHLASQG